MKTTSKPHRCDVCSKGFGTTEALAEHRSAKKHGDTVDAAGTSPMLSTLLSPLSCRGNTYSRLSATEQSSVYDRLVPACHPQRRLEQQGYPLEAANGVMETASTEGEFLPTPTADKSFPKRKAVVLDCEMAGGKGGQSELIMLTAVDFLTGEELVNSLVHPRQPILDWRSAITGITPTIMSLAVTQKTVLEGWPAARSQLWSYIDENTVLVGHSLEHDLGVLHMVHRKVVDSAILTNEVVFGKGKMRRVRWGLQALCQELLGLGIRQDSPSGKKSHDSTEDTLAARELVLFCLREPGKLKTWADRRRQEFWKRGTKQGSRNEKREKRGTRDRKAGSKGAAKGGYQDDSDSEYESLRWEDVIDREMWPKSPPDSD